MLTCVSVARAEYLIYVPVSGSTASEEAPLLISCAAKLEGLYTCSDVPPSSSP